MVLGVWLIAAPAVLGYRGLPAEMDRIVGPTVAAVAVIALTEATRSVRWLNLPLGMGLMAAPLMLNYPGEAALNSALCGFAIAALSIVRGKMSHQMGGGWAALFSLGEDEGSARS